MADVMVIQTGRTWSILVNGELVEGGFFSRDVALDAASEWRRGVR